MSSSAPRTRTTKSWLTSASPSTQYEPQSVDGRGHCLADAGGQPVVGNALMQLRVHRAHGLNQRGVLCEGREARGRAAPELRRPALGIGQAMVQQCPRHAPRTLRRALVGLCETGAPTLRGARDQGLDETVLGREVVHEPALAHARLGCDRVQRQVRDALAHDHRLGSVEKGLLQVDGGRPYHHGPDSTDRAVCRQPTGRFFRRSARTDRRVYLAASTCSSQLFEAFLPSRNGSAASTSPGERKMS